MLAICKYQCRLRDGSVQVPVRSRGELLLILNYLKVLFESTGRRFQLVVAKAQDVARFERSRLEGKKEVIQWCKVGCYDAMINT